MVHDGELSVSLFYLDIGGIWLDPEGIVVGRVNDHGSGEGLVAAGSCVDLDGEEGIQARRA
jgi:hypothetical protein